MNGKFPAKLDSPAKASKNAKNKKGTSSSAASNGNNKVDKVALAAQSNAIIAAGQRQKWNFEQETMYVQFCIHFLYFCCDICPSTVCVVKCTTKSFPKLTSHVFVCLFPTSLAEAVGRYGEGNWQAILHDPEYAVVVSLFYFI